MSHPSCPSREELSAYLQGLLAPPEADAVTVHLDRCSNCEETIQSLDPVGDSFIQQLKRLRESQPFVDEAACSKAVAAVRRQSPAATGAADGPGTAQAPAQVPAQARPLKYAEFVEFVTTTGLVAAGDLKAVEAQLPPAEAADVQALARLLVERGKLTKYQAAAVYQGKGKSLVYGDYLVLDRIGAGGMGQVFKARHQRMDRIVALKVLATAAMKNADSVRRFEREVRAAARLIHPNIVHAYDAGRQDGVHYLVMELVEGTDLSSLVKKQGKLSIRQACDYVAQAARGFAFAHAQGIVHRDIKPGNLLVNRDGAIKILDMGLARFDDGGEGAAMQAELTASGAVMGTVDYMAPEQAMNTRHADAKSDVYGLGCTLYRLVSGESVFAGETMVEKIIAHRERPIPSLKLVRADAPPTLEAMITRMLAKDPAVRPTMQEVADGLNSLAAGGAEVTVIGGSGTEGANQGAAPPVASPLVGLPGTAAGAGFAGRGPQIRSASPPRRKSKFPLVAAAGAGAIFIACAVWVVLRDRGGNEVGRFQVPEGGNVEVKEVPADAGRPGATPSGSTASLGAGVPASSTPSSTAAPTANALPISTDPERRAVEWAQPLGAKINLITAANEARTIYGSKPPEGPFTVTIIDFRESISPNVEGRRTITDDMLANLSGLKGIYRLTLPYAPITDAGLKHLTPLGLLNHLDLSETRITDAGLRQLKAFPHLSWLYLSGLPITDAGLEHLKPLVKLNEGLRLDKTQITDAGLAHLRVLPTLRVIDLSHTRTTDRGLVELASFPQLQGVTLNGTAVTSEGVARLQAAKPKLKITWDPTIAPAFNPTPVAAANSPVPAFAGTPPAVPSVGGDLWIDAEYAPSAPPVIAVPAVVLDGSTPLTVEAWSYSALSPELLAAADRSGSKQVERTIFGFGGRLGVRWELHATLPKNDRRFIYYNHPLPTGGNSTNRVSCGSFARNTPQHVALTVAQPAAGQYEFTVWSEGKKVRSLGSEFIPDAAQSLLSQGAIDEIRVSKVIRYTADFTPQRRFEPDADTLGLYHCDEGSGDLLIDSSGHNRHGTLTNAKWAPVPGQSPSPASVASSAAPAVATGPVDLLALVDLNKHIVHGTWTRVDGKLVGGGIVNARVQVPFTPPAEYDVTLTGRQISDAKAGILVGLVAKGRQFFVQVGPNFVSPSINGLIQNPYKVAGVSMSLREPFRLICSVRNDGVSVTLDGRKLLEYRDDFNLLGMAAHTAMPEKSQLFIGGWEDAVGQGSTSPEANWEITGLVLTPGVGAASVAASSPPSDAVAFGGHYYKLVYDLHVRRNDAKAKCEAAGGYLACINSQPELDFLLKLQNEMSIPNVHKTLWLGGDSSSSQWRWESGEPFTFFPGGTSPVVRRPYLKQFSDGRWADDADESNQVGGYICEWSAAPSTLLTVGATSAVATTPNPGTAVPGLSPSTATRHSVPDTTVRQAALATVKDVFKDDYAAAKTPAKKSELAGKLYEQSRQAVDATEKYVLLDEALALGAEGDEVDHARRALKSLVEEFDVGVGATYVGGWKSLLAKARPPEIVRALLVDANQVFDSTVKAAQFDDAKAIGDFATTTAARLRDVVEIKLVRDRNAELVVRQKEHAAAKAALEKLSTTPDDPEANLAVGRYRALVEKDWANALPLLAKGSDTVWKDLAVKTLAAGNQPAALSAVADAWWDAAQAKPAQKAELTAGARFWYQAALGSLAGLQKTRVENRITEAGLLAVESKIPVTLLPLPASAAAPAATTAAGEKPFMPDRTFGDPKPATPAVAAPAVGVRPNATLADPAFQQWMKDVAAMPAQQQVDSVSKKMVELNPGFDGTLTPVIRNDMVTDLKFLGNNVANIAPVRALAGLKVLNFNARSSTVFDLSPLQDMSLTNLHCDGTSVSDLSPLRGMPLTTLSVAKTPVSDLSPLRGMPLTTLNCASTKVRDLSPLADCKQLQKLTTTNSQATPAMIEALKQALPNCQFTQ